MKTIVTAVLALVIGFGLGWTVGYVNPKARANREAMKQFAKSDADDSMAAAVAYRAIMRLSSGDTQGAMKSLAWPIGLYYRANRGQPETQERSNFLAQIERLASTNQVLAAEINRKVE